MFILYKLCNIPKIKTNKEGNIEFLIAAVMNHHQLGGDLLSYQIFYLSVLEIRSLKCAMPTQSQNVGRVAFLWGECISLPFPPSRGCPHFLAYGPFLFPNPTVASWVSHHIALTLTLLPNYIGPIGSSRTISVFKVTWLASLIICNLT